MDGWLKQSVAITLSIGPFLDSTDGNTQETALTIAQADVVLSKAGGAFAAKNDATSCTHDTKGYYSCPLNVTDTGTLGMLKLAVHVAGALAVWHTWMVVSAQVWDSLFGADKLDVAVVEQANIDFGALQKASLNAATPASVVGAVGSVTGAVGSVTGAVGSVTAGVTVATNNDKTGYGLSAAAVQAVWDALLTALTTAGSIGKKLADWVVGTIDTYTGNTKQTGDAFARLGAPSGASISADIAAVKSDSGAILADTGTDGVVVNAAGLAADAVDEILDEIVEGTITLRQAMRLLLAADSGKSGGGGTATLTFRDVADLKARITATVDANGNRTAITRDGT